MMTKHDDMDSEKTNKMTKKDVVRKPHEFSFTLLEVIIAVGLLTAVVMQVAGGQGSLFEITDYSKKATEATWLAKRIMSEVEYNYSQYALKDLETSTSIKDEKFKDVTDPDFDYRYSIDIQEWKLPLIDFITGGGGKSKEEKAHDKDEGKADSAAAGIPGLDAMVKQIFDGHMMKVAHVEVSWAEGARRDSVALTYLMTNQKKLDDYILAKVAVWDKVRTKMNPNAVAGGKPGTPGAPGTAVPGAAGTPTTPGTNTAIPGTPNGTGGRSPTTPETVVP
ncbi:MAG: hypothetical protein H7249_13245 [Chitinophagaceae bacterium]|nr:hypothetical protein [Oligoflexus sp.]